LLTSYRNEIEAAITVTLQEWEGVPNLYDPIRYLFEGGGKRVRPILTLLACEAVGGERRHAMGGALAAEFLHAFTLLHDDIMDRSPLRRGRDTVHIRYGENAAILSGDVMMGIAMKLTERSALHASDPLSVMSALSQGLIDVCEGQALDMAFMDRTDVSIDEYFAMIERKTSRLLEMSVSIGALIGGGSTAHIAALRQFARDIGLAFQLQDDLLDLIGSERFGKTPGGDIVEGKRTWMILRMRDHASTDSSSQATMSKAEPLIKRFFAEGGLSSDDVSQVVDAMTELGVISEAEQLVVHHTEEAFRYLAQLPETPARTDLQELATLLMSRTS
jgi:geranylgeranyl diphosphate synthase, type II